MKHFVFFMMISVLFTFCKKRNLEPSYCENPYSSSSDTIYLNDNNNYFNHVDGLTYILEANNWAGNTDNFIWNTGDTANSITVSTPAEYTLYVYSNNWELYDSTTFYIGTLTENIQVPNSFTPNGDGINDLFSPIVNNICIESYAFIIYDKYNIQTFTSYNPNIRWDGTYKGMAAPLGLYTYQIQATTIEGKLIQKEATINLLR